MASTSGRDFDHLEAELALGDFLERDIHEGQLRVIGDQGAKTLPKLADPLGNNVHENLGAMHDFEGILDERLFHIIISVMGKGPLGIKGKQVILAAYWHKSSLSLHKFSAHIGAGRSVPAVSSFRCGMILWYVTIKLGEWIIWSGIGIYFLLQALLYQAHPRWLYLALATAFFVFGFADFIEYFTNGTFPWWLWAWKIIGGLVLFALLVTRDYVQRGRPALSPWRFVAAAVILALALVCILKP